MTTNERQQSEFDSFTSVVGTLFLPRLLQLRGTTVLQKLVDDPLDRRFSPLSQLEPLILRGVCCKLKRGGFNYRYVSRKTWSIQATLICFDQRTVWLSDTPASVSIAMRLKFPLVNEKRAFTATQSAHIFQFDGKLSTTSRQKSASFSPMRLNVAFFEARHQSLLIHCRTDTQHVRLSCTRVENRGKLYSAMRRK